MAYQPGVPPSSTEPQAILRFLEQELASLARAINDPEQVRALQPLAVEPPKPRRGLLVYADGENWDPGSGEGAYCFNGSVWVFLG